MFLIFFGRKQHCPEPECPYELEPQEAHQMPWSNCRGCKWLQNELCLSPLEPRVFANDSGQLVICIDREPWWAVAMQQARETATKAWREVK